MKRHGSMNRVYRLIWSCAQSAWIPVAELARGRGKSSLRKLSIATLSLASTAALAGPEGGQVTAGAGAISQAGVTTTINQSSQNLSLNWQSFNIAAQETVNFVQPGASAIAVNRILDTNGSQILGHLNANGQVYLINPNGILFGQGAQVNVGGLVASTLDLNDAALAGDKRSFSGNGAGSVINHGAINAVDGGYVALLGNRVSNDGTITAPNGAVALGAGSAATLTFSNNSMVSMQVDASVLNSQADNGGLIRADGGIVVMTAGAKDSLLASVVNNTGVIEAHAVENRDGSIVLLGGMQAGTVNVAGTLDASAPNGGNGGFIETSAAQVNVADHTKITTAASIGLAGTWLIDPVDFTIAASGGNMTGTTLSSNLGGGNVVIQSSSGSTGTLGDVNVNDAVTWSAHKLTLNAQNNININANLNASSSASLAFEYGQGAVAANNTSRVVTNGASVNLPASTTNFTTKQGSNGAVKNYTVITSLGAAGSTTATDLQGIAGNLTTNYALGSNIDAAATSTWNAGAGFAPIGNGTTRFAGIFDGLGHTVSGLYINRTAANTVGLFGYTAAGSMVRNVGLIGGSVASTSWGTGALVGALGGTLFNSYATSSVYGFQTVGGLVGVIDGGAIIDSHASGNVSSNGNGEVGGLVGLSWGPGGGTVSNSYATGNVSSTVGNVGGLMGINWGHITDSYATGTANGTDYIGGLVGNNSNGSVASSYSSGAASGRDNVGGLVGNNSNTVSTSHASGAVTGRNNVGGVAGSNGGTFSTNYATGAVTGSDAVGGLIGTSISTTSNSHATGAVTGVSRVGGLIGYGYGSNTINNYATGTVSGITFVGGLMGKNIAGTIGNSYAAGSVSGSSYVGGLVGGNVGGNGGYGDGYGGTAGNGGNSTISNSYALGAVNGAAIVGGLVGGNLGGNGGNGGSYDGTPGTGGDGGFAIIENSYSRGAVTGSSSVGGLIGTSVSGATGQSVGYGGVGVGGGGGLSSVATSYWNTDTSGRASSAGGTGLTASQMQSPASFTGFNFTTTPGATGNNWIVVSLDGSLNNGGGEGTTLPMLASEYSTTINNAHQLQLMAMDLTASYTLGQNINAAATGAVNDVWSGGTFIPVGKDGARFTGTLNGLGHTINNLNIDMPGADTPGLNSIPADQAGLFGYIGATGSVRNVGLVGGSVVGRDFVGAFAGQNAGTVTNSYASGTVQGRAYVGGLIGYNISTGTATGSHATGGITASSGDAGGLIGLNDGALSNSYATGAVQSGENAVGGLVGYNSGGASINNSYAGGAVNGSNYVGGLAGRNYGDVHNSYATGSVQGLYYVGGLLGGNYGAVSNTYATGLVQSTSNAGGLLGTNYGSVTNSFWNNETSSQASSNGGTGLTSNQMMQLSSFSSWNTATPNTIANIGSSGASWRIYEGNTAPLLTQFLTALTLTDTVVATYNGAAHGSSIVIPSNVFAATETNAGTYAAFYSNQHGYDITGGTLTINKANLTLSGTRAFDGTRAVAGSVLTATGVAGETFALSGAGDSSNLANKNVQTGSALSSLTGLALGTSDNGGLAGNYNALSTVGSSVSITRANLTVGTSDVTKTYDGVLAASGVAAVTGGTLFGSDSLSGGIFAFTNANAGAGNKTVTTSGITVSDGNSGGNYNVSYANNTTSTISKANLALSTSDVTKTYDGTLTAPGTAIISSGTLYNNASNGGVLDSLSGGIFEFLDANAGAGNKVVTASGMTVSDGNGGGNYNVSYANNTTSTINTANLILSSGSVTKTYDGSLTAAGSAAVVGGTLFGSDSLNGGSFSFVDKNVGNGNKTVTATGVTVNDGNSGSNYNVTYANNTTSTIDAAHLLLSTSSVTKIYDGGLAASGVATIAGGSLFGGDSLSGGSFAFTDKNVGSGNKTVMTSDVTINDGNSGANYSVGYIDNTTSTIAAVNLAVTGVTANNKIYDGATATTLAGLATVTPIGADVVSISGAGSGAFLDANIGVGKAVTVSGFALSGTDASNYTIMQPAGLVADITASNVVPEVAPAAELQNVIGQIQSSTFFPLANIQSPPSLSPELVDTQKTDSDSSTPNAAQNVGTSGGGVKSVLQIVDGGMKLSDSGAEENDGQ